jgi:hypothetical protein
MLVRLAAIPSVIVDCAGVDDRERSTLSQTCYEEPPGRPGGSSR